tara:strand:- start:1122 stop:1364 length:243 start_codon:yes stop_codon:yes gene_type:complete
MFSINQILYNLFEAVNIILIIRIILSWIPHNKYHPLIKVIYIITEPLLKPFKNMINPIQGIDISPIILFILLNFFKNFFL